MNMTEIHDSNTCRAGFNSRPCEMCRFAGQIERSRSKSPSEPSEPEIAPAGFLASKAESASEVDYAQSRAISAPTFTSEWDAAPRSMTRTTERECAEYWFERGKLAGRVAEMVEITREGD